MDLREFAEIILFATTLEDKLFRPQASPDGSLPFTDLAPGRLTVVPGLPGRPEFLRFAGRAMRSDFPAVAEMDQDHRRGQVLHYFANHELLAMELMALALLRFPDAPAGFRMGIARTILEEQDHMRLYMERMAALGVEFGSVPVNRFFWDCLAGIEHPMQYVSGMCLTLEQANLDYSLFYRDVFTGIGDHDTAAVMSRVLTEEIGHVKHGVVWLNRWRRPDQSEWDAYCAGLPPTLSPGRARGIIFDLESRLQSGLSRAFCDQLSVYRHSRGRPPDVFWLNPAAEMEVLFPGPSWSPPQPLENIAADLDTLPMFVAREDDVVMVRRQPAVDFLKSLQETGFVLPQFCTDPAELRGRLVHQLVPWGLTPHSIAAGRAMGLNAQVSLPDTIDREVYSKAWCAQVCRDLHDAGDDDLMVPQVIRSYDDAVRCLQHHFSAPPGGSAQSRPATLVIKAPYGSSGRNMVRIRTPGADERQLAWLAATLKTQHCVVIEPWLDRQADFSVQFDTRTGVRPLDPVIGVTRQITDLRGQYRGHYLGRRAAGLSQDLKKAVHTLDVYARLAETARRVAARLREKGHQGPAGIDAFLYRTPQGLRLRSLVEINPRLTMGRVALEINRCINHGCDAVWLHLNQKQVQASGSGTFVEFAAMMRTRFPPVMRDGDTLQRRGLITSGAVATNDPDHARQVLTMLFVGEAFHWAQEHLAYDMQATPVCAT